MHFQRFRIHNSDQVIYVNLRKIIWYRKIEHDETHHMALGYAGETERDYGELHVNITIDQLQDIIERFG